jgi:adenylate kinase
MILVFLGPPGCGKGTQAKLVEEKLKIPHIALGDILREAVSEGSEVGLKAQSFLKQGKLVPDSLVIEVTKERINKPDCASGFILDGFPRTMVQAESLDSVLESLGKKVDRAVYFTVSLEEIIKRISGRRSCKNCGRVYHVTFNRPKENNKCDNCGIPLYQREDDREETIRTRFEVYQEKTAPLVEYYRKQGKLVEVDGGQELKKVFREVSSVLGLS